MFSKNKLLVVAMFIFCAFGLVNQAAAKKTLRIEVIRDNNGVPVKCADDPVCHNRWVPGANTGIQSVAVANPGDTVVFETRDAFDNQFNRDTVPSDVAAANLNLVHPLTGPVYVNGAEAGDVLAVTVVSVVPGPDRFGYTVAVPGFGFLRDLFTDPFIVRWELRGKGRSGKFSATSEDLPGVRIPGNGFAGTMGVAFSDAKTDEVLTREADLLANGGFVLPPEPLDAAPDDLCGVGGPLINECLRTIPPRENGGNMDVKQMIAGTTLLFPCFVDGCLLSTGDVHFAQGDGEVAGTAIEMNAVVTVKVDVRKGEAGLIRRPQIEGTARPNLLKKLAPKRFLATTGLPIKEAGEFNPQLNYLNSTLVTNLANLSEDATLAARDALINMIDLLIGPRSPAPVPLSRVQAYILSSVAVDLHISQMVDVPNFVVTAILPLDIFRKQGGP